MKTDVAIANANETFNTAIFDGSNPKVAIDACTAVSTWDTQAIGQYESVTTASQGRGSISTEYGTTDSTLDVNGTFILTAFTNTGSLLPTDSEATSVISAKGKGTMSFHVKANGSGVFNHSIKLSPLVTKTVVLIAQKQANSDSNTLDNAKASIKEVVNEDFTYIVLRIPKTANYSSIESSVQGKIDSLHVGNDIAALDTVATDILGPCV
jgi:hypothetical protein